MSMTSGELMTLAAALGEQRHPYALVTVVRAIAPTSAYAGAQAIVLADGTLHGWIGGGCARSVVISVAQAAIENGEPRLVRIGNDSEVVEEGVERHAMSCASNGTIELFIQPYSARAALCVLGETPAAEEARFLAGRLGIRLLDAPDDAPVTLIATQGQGDEAALEAALRAGCPQVLMIASRRKADKLRETMRRRGIDDEMLAHLHAPAGPDAGAKTPVEIALVAMAGVLAALRGRTALRDALADAMKPAPQAAAAMTASPMPVSVPVVSPMPAAARTFVNPVCGMAVDTARPVHVEAFEGTDYYFCCDGCWHEFRRTPDKYAQIHRAAQRREVPA